MEDLAFWAVKWPYLTKKSFSLIGSLNWQHLRHKWKPHIFTVSELIALIINNTLVRYSLTIWRSIFRKCSAHLDRSDFIPSLIKSAHDLRRHPPKWNSSFHFRQSFRKLDSSQRSHISSPSYFIYLNGLLNSFEFWRQNEIWTVMSDFKIPSEK